MNKLTDFDIEVLNKEIKQLSFAQLKEILTDCSFRSATVDLNKIETLISTIDYAPEEKKESIWEELKDVICETFTKATIQISPRYFICETPVCTQKNHCGEPTEVNDSAKKRKTTKK